jgi:squalene synthase HpnC
MSRDLERAYAACERLAREHYENFPVASRLLPAPMRPHVAAVYAFARGADDLADEGARSDAERLRLLDAWVAKLGAAVADPGAAPGDTEEERLVFTAVAHSIAARGLPVSLFEDLVSAFSQDVTKRRYADWDEVLDYCRRSANPVGRLVLRIAGYDDPDLDRSSDALCTALQLTNFWQDLEGDWRRGRIYVPRDELEASGAREEDLERGALTPAWRAALERAAGRTRDLFGAGRAVCDGVGGRLGWELRLTWLGGARILERLARDGYDAFAHRPTLGWGDAPVLLWRLVRWKSRS